MSIKSALSVVVFAWATFPADHSSVRADEKTAKSIPVVSTWGELRKSPVVSSGDYGHARVGIRATEAPRNSGVLVYCLVSQFDPMAFPSRFDHEAVLGPLDCQIGTGDQLIARAKVLMEQTRFTEDATEVLFTRVVAIDQIRQFVVELKERNGTTVIARGTVSGTDTPYHGWSPFSPGTKLQADLPADETDTYYATLSSRPRGIALPAHDGMSPVDWDGSNRRHADSDRLPTLIPTKANGSLTLEGDHRRLRIRSTTEMIVARPDWHFLARWWVNGKPFTAPAGQSISDQNGLIITGRRIDITFEFDGADVGAKSGDTIGLQLLHLPDGWRVVHSFAEARLAAEEVSVEVPRLTNRIEFQVP